VGEQQKLGGGRLLAGDVELEVFHEGAGSACCFFSSICWRRNFTAAEELIERLKNSLSG